MTLTSRDPEPPAGSLVRDACGLEWERDWDGGNACWSHPDGDGDHETWSKIAGNYGPVTLLEHGNQVHTCGPGRLEPGKGACPECDPAWWGE